MAAMIAPVALMPPMSDNGSIACLAVWGVNNVH
jgi:hypothetical protein